MIVVDSNIIAYCWIKGDKTALAQELRLKEPDWHVPVLWRSEMRSILAGYVRRGILASAQARTIMADAESVLHEAEHLPASAAVFDLIEASPCSAYDCEFAALARSLKVPLVTADKQLLDAFPSIARTLEQFLGS